MALITVTSVEVLPKARLLVRLSRNRVIQVDVSQYLSAPGYERLCKPTFFAKVGIAVWGHGVCWPGDIVIPAEALYRLAKEQSGHAWPTRFFNAWMDRNGMSDVEVAKIFGLPKRTIVQYATGNKSIPIYIGLACDGWEHRNFEKKMTIARTIAKKYRHALDKLAKSELDACLNAQKKVVSKYSVAFKRLAKP